MRIVWVKANKILPVHSGGDIRSFNILRELAVQNELVFLSYYDGPVDETYERELQERLPGAVAVSTGRAVGSSVSRGLDYLMTLLNKAPYAVSRFASVKVQERLKRCLGDPRPDAVVCDFLDAAINFPNEVTVPSVLFQHNVESEIWRRHAETETNPAKRMVYRLEFKRILEYEKAALQRFHHVIAVSAHDRELMSGWVDASRITVVPTGVDLGQYAPDHSKKELAPLVMFVGAMDWEPNIDAVEYFCHSIWPAVLAQIPGARFRIVGRNPDRRVLNCVSTSVEVTGRVPSVIEHLREAAVVVVPLRIGGGTRLKIYEAMAAGKAVVSTSVGAEGLDVHAGQDIILEDSPETFADSIVMLLRDAERRKQFERSAAELAGRYSWKEVGKTFEAVLARISGVGTRLPAGQFSAAAVRTADRPMA